MALGCGQAREELHLIQILQKTTPIQKIRLFLLDTSPMLLNIAHERAQEHFQGYPGIEVFGIYGNFHHLQRYKELLSVFNQENHMLVATMLGLTWTNLENELLLLRSGIRALPQSTIFFMDVMDRYAEPGDRSTLFERDPWLKGRSKWQRESDDFLALPLRVYREGMDMQELSWEYVLDDVNPYVPNSYTVEVRAHLKPDVQFTLRKFKRYQQEGLRDAFDKEGWTLFRSFSFGLNMRAILFQKR